MNKTISIQIKAALLLVVFAWNTLAGFACVIGMNTGFNAATHHEKVAQDHHDNQQHDQTNETEKSNCCQELVVQLSNNDHAVPQADVNLPVIFLSAFIAIFYIDISSPSQANYPFKFIVQSYHPPIPDIRLAIHSFQI